MKVTIHQPEHLPWLGFFNKAINCEKFVLLNNVQYEKNYFQNRNNILDVKNNKRQFVTVPVNKGKQSDLILEKKICFTNKLKRRYFLKLKQAYDSYPYYNEISKNIFKYYEGEDNLAKLNENIIEYLFDYLNIECTLIRSSDIIDASEIHPGGCVNYQICKRLGAKTYLSGKSGREYLDVKPFEQDGIEVLFQDFRHPTYNQPGNEFVSNLSVLDIVFSFDPDHCVHLIKSGYTINND